MRRARLRQLIAAGVVLAGAAACSLLAPLDDHAASGGGGSLGDGAARDGAEPGDDGSGDDGGGTTSEAGTDAQGDAGSLPHCSQPGGLLCVDFDEPNPYPGWKASYTGAATSVRLVTDAAPPAPSPPAALLLHVQGAAGTSPIAQIETASALPASAKGTMQIGFDLFVPSGCVIAPGDAALLVEVKTSTQSYGPALTGHGDGGIGLLPERVQPSGVPSFGVTKDIPYDTWLHVSATICASAGGDWPDNVQTGTVTPQGCTPDASFPTFKAGAGLDLRFQRAAASCTVRIDNVLVSTP